MFGPHFRAIKTWNNNTRGCPLSWWPLLTCYLWIGTIHCWLPQASVAFWDCPKLVPKVSHILLIVKIFKFTRCRCTAQPENLDDLTAHCHSHEKTDFLIKCFHPNVVWSEQYPKWCCGRWMFDFCCSESDSDFGTAFHTQLSSCRHSWAPVTQSPPPVD